MEAPRTSAPSSVGTIVTWMAIRAAASAISPAHIRTAERGPMRREIPCAHSPAERMPTAIIEFGSAAAQGGTPRSAWRYGVMNPTP